MESSFSERLKKVRLAKQLNQTKCAELLNISLPTINRLERGHRVPDADLVIRIAKALECDLVWLLTGQESGGISGVGHKCPILSKLTTDLRDPPRELVEGWLSLPDLPPETAAIRVRDDSMSPIIKWGDIVVFTIGEDKLGDLAVLVDQNEQVHIRRGSGSSGREEFLSENPEYRGRVDSTKLKCVGRVRKIIRNVP